MSSNYNQETLEGIYTLGRMFYYHGFSSEAEKVALGLLSLQEHSPNPKLLLGAINFEKGNYSLAANYFRTVSQLPDINNKSNNYSSLGKLGLLACFVALKDINRAESIAFEIEKKKESIGALQKDFLELYQDAIKRYLKSSK